MAVSESALHTSIDVKVHDYSATNPVKANRYCLHESAKRSDEPITATDVTILRTKPDNLTERNDAVDDDYEKDDSNYVRLVQVPGDKKRNKFDALMTNVGFTETLAVGGIERGFVQRSCASLCHYESDQRCKAELNVSAPRQCPTSFAETLHCYGQNTTRRRFRSAIEYQPKMVPSRYSDTQYVLPKRMTTTYVSYVDVSGQGDQRRPKWYSSSVDVEPVTVSNVVVGGFRWLRDDDPDDAHLHDGYESSSGISSDDDEGDDGERRSSSGRLGQVEYRRRKDADGRLSHQTRFVVCQS